MCEGVNKNGLNDKLISFDHKNYSFVVGVIMDNKKFGLKDILTLGILKQNLDNIGIQLLIDKIEYKK